MAYVDGETRGERIRRQGALSGKEAVGVLREIAWALAYAHAEGVVPRDVKPGNVLLEKGSGRVLVTDFGIAQIGIERAGSGEQGRSAERDGTGESESFSAAGFMSPEQVSGGEDDARSDIYALGVVGFYLLAGRLPVEAATAADSRAQHRAQAAPPVASVAPGVPAAVAQAVDRCLRKSPEDRFADGAALAEAIGGTAVKRDTPVPLRIFNKNIRELAINVPAMFVIWWLLVGGVMTVAVVADEFLAVSLVAALLLVVGTILQPLKVLGSQTRGLLRARFGVEDVRVALDREVSGRNEEIRFEHGKKVALVDHLLRVLTWGIVTGGLGTLVFGAVTGLEDLTLLSWASLQFSGVAAGIAAYRNKRRRDAIGEGWLGLLRTRVGKWLFKLGGIGLDREALASGGAHRPTEMAISIAADRLFEELPRSVRRDLPELPETIRKLGAEAQSMRQHVEQMNALLAQVGDPTRVGDDERTQLRGDLQATRDEAKTRMTDAVSALEKIRMGLLRMHAGAGSVESLTQDLGSVQALSEHIEHLLAGQQGVHELLGISAATEASTPRADGRQLTP